jgi:hypothetical protein
MRLAGFYLFARRRWRCCPMLFPGQLFRHRGRCIRRPACHSRGGPQPADGLRRPDFSGPCRLFRHGRLRLRDFDHPLRWPSLLALACRSAGDWLTLAWLLARPILRLRGHYLAMATLGFGIIVHVIMVQATHWTGGPDGLWPASRR